MNPVVDYFLFCENVIVGERGRFTFANVYDEVYVLSLPTVVKALFVAIKVGLPGAKPNDKPKFELKITNPAKKVVTKSLVQDFTVPETKFEGATLNVEASFLPIDMLGKYRFDLLINNKVIHTKYLEIKDAPEDLVL